MEIRSLAFRTDLAMLEHSGSRIEDHGDLLVMRTPDNPTYWWGNFLLLPAAPLDRAEAEASLVRFEAELPAARHRTFGVDGAHGSLDDLAPFAGLGFETECSTVMTATDVHEPPRPNRTASYRTLETDADAAQARQLTYRRRVRGGWATP